MQLIDSLVTQAASLAALRSKLPNNGTKPNWRKGKTFSGEVVKAKARKLCALFWMIFATRCPTSPHPTINNLGRRNRAGNAPKPTPQKVLAFRLCKRVE